MIAISPSPRGFNPESYIIHHCGQLDCCNFVMATELDRLIMANDQFYCGFCQEKYEREMKELDDLECSEENIPGGLIEL